MVTRYVEHDNQVRWPSAIGYLTPADKLAGGAAEIFAARDRKLAEARERRKARRAAARLRTVACSRESGYDGPRPHAEDRAPVGTGLSADPGVVSEGRAVALAAAHLLC